MKLLNIVFLAFFCAIVTLKGLPDQSLMRDLIILLDDAQETSPGKIGAIVHDMQNALQAETAPLLVSASLWRTFITARQEWMLQASIPDTDEYKSIMVMKDINERIAYWFNVLKSAFDTVHTCSLVAEKINEEFYVEERYKQLKKEGRIPKNDSRCIRYCGSVPCSFGAWYWFYLDTNYYLAIPKKYAAQCTSSTDLKDILIATGFNAELAERVVDPLDIVYEIKVDTELLSADTTIISVLRYLFKKNDTNPVLYRWSLYIDGHGNNYKLMRGYNQTMVGMSLETFKKVCIFFDENLSVHLLWVSSCKAGGINRMVLTDGGKIYHYPIVVESIGDVVSYGNLDYFDFFPDGKFLCTGYCFKKIDNKWQLWDRSSKRFNKFFKKIHEMKNNFVQEYFKSVQEQIYEAFTKITPQCFITNIPHILKPYSDSWFLCYPESMTYVNVQSVLLAEACEVPHMLRTKVILIDAPVCMTGLQIVSEHVRYILSVTPGNTSHYCISVSAHHVALEELLQCFGPSDVPSFTKYFLFDTVTCFCDPKDAITTTLGLTSETVAFHTMLIQVCKDGQLIAMFTIPSGDAYMISMRKVDGKFMMRNLQKLSQKATEIYRTQYEKTKTGLIANATQAYAPLKAKYIQALGKEKVVSDEIAQV